MKISLNWLKDYIDTDLPAAKIAEILTSIGLEEEGMEEKESIKGGLVGIVVGEVLECGRHPNADKLSLTKVDIGREEALQIVCGAPNVAQGQKVMVATIGTTLYDGKGEPWKIKKGKIRGEASEGMICAEDELGIGDDHDGIIVLPETVAVGTPGRDYYEVETDVVFDIGLTPNRSDATSHLGVARDLAAALHINHQHPRHLKLPDVSAFQVGENQLPIAVRVENTEACPRYSGLSIVGLTVKESPNWLKNKLLAIGSRPINNIVDITNFVLHELGQPLHAFDADRIGGGEIVVKTLPAGTTFQTLDEVARELHAEDLMICDGHSKGLCIAGVFGGVGSGVTETTTRVFLESAYFDPKWVRRTSMRHQLRTDAATRYEKGADPNITIYALQRAALLMQELAGGTIASEIIDLYPQPIAPHEIDLRFQRVNQLIGTEIPPERVRAILNALEIEVLAETETGMRVAIPTNKHDVLREVDVIEEILRIYGLNEVPISSQVRSSISLRKKPDPPLVRYMVSETLAGGGAREMMGLSLTQSRYFREILPLEEAELVFVNNTSNTHLDVMRPVMLFSGLEAVLHNVNRQQGDLRLFEWGKTYRPDGEGFREREHLTLLVTGYQHGESWLTAERNRVSYYDLKTQVENVLRRLGLESYQVSPLQDEIWAYGMKYHRGEQILVQFGRVQGQVTKGMGIKQEVFYADFHWDAVLKALRKHKIDFVELNKYPTVRRDLALVVDNSVKFEDIVRIANKAGKKLLKEVNLFDVYVNEAQLGAGKKSYAVSYLFEDPSRTLKDKEVDKVTNQLIRQYEAQLGATIRR
ncbi:MAG: phenylalanine--tRNA ligase subunit beta [Bacteroidota bacterium]